jgi:hypothetical protein
VELARVVASVSGASAVEAVEAPEMEIDAARTVNDTARSRVDETEVVANPGYRCGATTIHVASARC